MPIDGCILNVDTGAVMAITVRIRKWGNSLGIRIPKPLAEKLGFFDGAEAELDIWEDALVLRPTRRFRLEDLLAGIEEENLHAETDWGTPLGREAW